MPIVRKPIDLNDFIEECTESVLSCSKFGCKKYIGIYGDAYALQEQAFKKGWRATKNNAYCPEHAKKLLKLK